MALQFIFQNPNGIGSSDRRIIRSHVMQGKNAGRPRRSTKKKLDTEVRRILYDPKCAYVMPRQVLWGDLCLTSFPQELDSESTALMHRWFFDISDALFPPQFCTKFDIIKSIWVNFILADEAYFHSTLAISASYVDFFQRKPAISSKTLHHISQAYALVNLKLSGPFSVSDRAIAAVVSLAIYQQVHHQPATGLVHLHGLYRMIQLRGGIARLMQENRALALKPLRLDVELAMQNGTPTLFHGDEAPVHPVLCDPDSRRSPRAAPWMPLILLELFSFSSLLNEVNKRQRLRLDPLDYTETIVSLLYHLTEVSPLRQAFTNPGLYSDVTYLAMLAFMTTLLPEYTRDGSSCPILSDRLGSAIQDLYITASGFSDSDPPFLLWILFISGISVLKLKDYPWLLPLIADTCATLELDSWAVIQQHLSQFPWIFALHDTPGRHLWDAIICLYRDNEAQQVVSMV
ncbi:hypothetical protein BO94DRAFT_586850 [Aspergillus sclerotioniger CBS 115572]|uniref:Transcription factor domain-containing protein n=1 Tax=Aspergillus sclerotioniger CBS 115572 TaxID=1450535 RepID=A0A317WDJ9_9EURO|nr:hypothetical protein BO94DRAFT_586850 [Aspergillus sclerotioniger CBS 115572]PWY83801.1 hypothetical protein BO94DRAFT_586850 [Aspergillus sclerotioniger CBS 115572]